MTSWILKNQKTSMSIARNWMFDYPCLSKHGDETNVQTFSLKEILIMAYNPCFENNIDVLCLITN